MFAHTNSAANVNTDLRPLFDWRKSTPLGIFDYPTFVKYNHRMSLYVKTTFTWSYWNTFGGSFPTGTPRRIHIDSFDIDITSIRWGPNFDELPRHFHVLFRSNFADWNIHVASTYFHRFNFTGRKSMLFPRTFFEVTSIVEKSNLFPSNFFDAISLVEICMLFLPWSVSPCF